MAQTHQSFEKDVDKFLDHFDYFDKLARNRELNTDQSIQLFAIFLMNHKYTEVEK